MKICVHSMRMNVSKLLVLAAWVWSVPVLWGAAPTTQPIPAVDDDIVFREGLRRRGLSEWLEFHLADNPPADETEAQMRRRERLLADAESKAGEIHPREASAILAGLIAKYPSHPSRLRWQLELARDYLDRQDPGAFEHVLTYELPSRKSQAVKELSNRAVEVLTGLRGEIAATWNSLESMEETALADLRDSGSLSTLEALDAESAMLLTGAKLYRALTADLDARQRASAFAEVMAELNGSGRLELPAGREAEQATAVLMAAVAERRLGRYDQADSHARQVIAILGRISDKLLRQRLRGTALVAVLEQIRAVRDAGRYEAALQAVEQARHWAVQSRSDEPHALVAVTLLEASVRCRKEVSEASNGAGPADRVGPVDWLGFRACLAALERTSQKSPAHRDLMYEVLGPIAGTDVGSATAFAVQLVGGATVSAARESGTAPPQLQNTISVLGKMLASSQPDLTPEVAGELRYLLGEALGLADAGMQAAQILTDLAEQAPHHDRAEAALRRAVNLAGLELRRAGPSGSPASRAAFVRAAGLMRGRLPNDPSVPELTYAISAALENDGHYEQAADEYAAVPASNARGRDAALGRIRCWRRALEYSAASQPLDSAGVASLAERAKAAVRAVREAFLEPGEGGQGGDAGSQSQPAGATPGCQRARLLLAVVELLNHPAVGQAREAALLTEGFEKQFACPELLGSVLRQRVLALRQLKRLSEARSVLEEYLAADPEHAGTAMAGLQQSMHEEILGSLDRGDAAAARAVAAEAVQVGRSLLEWGTARPGRLQPLDTLVIRFWHASAMLHAGEAKEAAVAFDGIVRESGGGLSADSRVAAEARLGKADALLEVNRTGEALDLYAAIWQSTPERSELWWHALVGSLRCHARLGSDPASVVQSIRQQRSLAPDLGGARWRQELTALEQSLSGRAATHPE